jgi:hypothetical protein
MKLIMTDVYLCEKCFHDLWAKGKMYADIWRISCKVYCERIMPVWENPDDRLEEMIEWLETKKYIVSGEINNELVIKPLGHYYLGNNQHGFCINMREHKPLFGAI